MSIDRRDFLRFTLGSSMALAIGGPLLAAAQGKGGAAARKARAVILLYMNGGPSQIDTFDPKAKSANAAGVKAIGTKVSGMQFSEFLPLLAKQANHLAVVRSIVSKEGNHQRARHLMHTGYVPAGGVAHPAFGAICSAEIGNGPLPGYVSIGGPGAPAGFLGAAHGPFAVQNPTRPVKNLARTTGIDEAQFKQRLTLWRGLEDRFAASHDSSLVNDQRAIAESAVRMMTAAETVAFDLSKESAPTRASYGEGVFSTGCLMARRLIEAGVPFVEVMQQGWDTHERNLERVKPLAADLDRGFSALIADLHSRGLLASTLVVWAGDFGRTPTVNPKGGRDHYPQVTPAVFAGAGVRGGQVIGASDKDGVGVTDKKLAVADLFASISHALGLDPDKQRRSPNGRPVSTVDNGTPIPKLFG
jgi:uncharacterized protein (DUF1501 family)